MLYSDDEGSTWQCSPGTSIPGELWANWEPTVWQDLRTDDVYMISRYNDFRSEAQGGPRSDQVISGRDLAIASRVQDQGVDREKGMRAMAKMGT